MYTIYTRSKREPFYLHDDALGEKLQQQWVSGTLPPRIQIGEWVGETAQIKAIEKGGKDSADDDWVEQALARQKGNFTDYIKQVNDEYRAYHNERVRRGIDVNATDLRVASFVWQANVGTKDIPEDAAQAIVERQRAYLEEHPGLTFANPICYKDIVENHTQKREPRQMVFSQAYMAMVHRILAEDKRAARELDSYQSMV